MPTSSRDFSAATSSHSSEMASVQAVCGPEPFQFLQLRLMEAEASLDSLIVLLHESGAEHVPVYGMACLVSPVLQRVKEAGRMVALVSGKERHLHVIGEPLP